MFCTIYMTKGLIRCAVNPAPFIVYEKSDFLILQLKCLLSFEVLTQQPIIISPRTVLAKYKQYLEVSDVLMVLTIKMK